MHATLSTVTSSREASRRLGGLGLFDLPTIVQTFAVTSAQRYVLYDSLRSLQS